MNRTKNLLGPCSHCGGMIDYPADLIGTVTPCPHCGKPTELLLAAPPVEPTIPRRALFWTVVAILVLIGGLIGSLVALKRAQNWAARHRAPSPPASGATNSAK